MKIYIITSGYYSSLENGDITNVCSTFERALEIVKKSCTFENLEQIRHRKTSELLNCWTSGDYWISIDEGYMDSECLYMSQEEYDKPYEELDKTSKYGREDKENRESNEQK